MSTHARTGLARKILTELDARPGQSSGDLAAVLGADVRACIYSLGTLVTDSKVIRTGTRQMPDRRKDCALYALTKLGRDALAKVQPSAMPKAVPKPPSRETGAVETVDEFLARGGKVQKLGTTWSPPTRYPQFRGVL